MERITFLPAFGVKPQPLVGRSKVIADFFDGLTRPVGHQLRTTFFKGQRGMGKTALLLELADRASQLDFVVARVTAGEKMLDEILQTIQTNGHRYISNNTKKVKGLSVGALGFSVGLTFSDEIERKYGFRIKLSMLSDELAKYDKGILILVDEVQSSGIAMRELATTYQHLMGEQKNLAIAMAGLPSAISTVLNDDLLTFLNRAHKVNLEPLPLPEIELYYSRALNQAGKHFEKASYLDEIVRASRGYPYLVQLIGYYVLELSEGDNTITQATLSAALKTSKAQLDENVYQASIRNLSNNDIAFLKAMSIDDTESASKDIRERLKKSNSHLQQYRKRLLEAGMIAQVRRGVYAHTLPYFNEYLRGEL